MRAIVGAVVATVAFLGCGSGSVAPAGGSGGPPNAAPGTVVISVELVGQGGGHVRSAEKSVDCPGTCRMTAAIGATVNLSQEPDANSVFVGWGGGCSGPGACSLTVKNDVTVWANFEKSAPGRPPPQCAGVASALPLAVSHEIAMAGNFSCFPALSDATGTLGLLTLGSRPSDGTCLSCTRQRHLFFVDASNGNERSFARFLGSPGERDIFVPQPDGFIVVQIGPGYLFAQHFDRAGKALSMTTPMVGVPVVKEAAPGGVVYAGDFRAFDNDWSKPPIHQACFLEFDLRIRWCRDLASKGAVVGLGTDAAGNPIVISNGSSGEIRAQWFATVGGGSNGAFTLLDSFTPGPNTWFETAPLIEGGVAVRRVDQQNDGTGRPYTTSQWLVTVPLGASRASPAPQWLASRPNTNMRALRLGNGYAMLPLGAPAAVCAQTIDIVAPDGTQCGSFSLGLESGQCRTEDVALSLDGTPIQLRSRDTVPGSCAYRWWPFALR